MVAGASAIRTSGDRFSPDKAGRLADVCAEIGRLCLTLSGCQTRLEWFSQVVASEEFVLSRNREEGKNW